MAIDGKLMSITAIYPVIAICCFLIAIFFYRKENVPLGKVLPFLIQSMSPHRMTEVFKKEGIWLIVLGFIVFIYHMITMTFHI